MRFDYFLGIDPGLIHDPTGMVLVRSQRPAVVVRDGKALDAATGQPVIVPKDMTVGEYVAPRYAVIDVQSIKGMTFDQAGREARAIMADKAGGGFLSVVDSTGLGRGCVDQVRKAGVPAIAVTLTSGSKITGGRWEINVYPRDTDRQVLLRSALPGVGDGGFTEEKGPSIYGIDMVNFGFVV